MKLIRLSLRHIAQHASLDIKFSDGLVAILGRNGDGKSNAMNAAYACLSGDYSRHSKGKAGYIRQGSPDNEPSYMEVEAEHGGTTFTVTRWLRPNGQKLVIGDKVFVKAADIDRELTESLGITPKLLDTYVFVRQWKTFEFIGSERERAMQFTRLCGTDDAERLWVMLGEQMDLDRTIADQVVDNSDELRKQRNEYAAKQEQADKQLTKLQSQLISSVHVKALEVDVKNWQAKQELLAKLDPLKTRVGQLFAEARTAVAEHKVKETELQDLLSKSEDLEAKAVLAKGAVTLFASRQKEWESRQRVETALAALVPPEKPEPTELPEAEELLKQRTWHENLRQKDSELLDNCDGVVTCPTCGQTTEALAAQIEEAKVRLPRLAGKIEKLHHQQIQRKAYDKTAAAYQQARAVYDSRKQQFEQQAAELADVRKPEGDVKASSRAIELAAAAKAAVAKCRTARDLAVSIKEQAKAAHKAAESRLEEIQTKLSHVEEVTESAAKAAETKLAQQRTREIEAAGLAKEAAAYKSMRDDVTEQLSRLEVRLSRSAKAREWVTLLDSIRNVVHRSNLPATVHRFALEDLVVSTNEHLSELQLPFRVAATESLAMEGHFPNGTVTAAADFSGGQKMLLALAYLLSVNALFAGQIGLLVLDEPTACVDEPHIEAMVETFANLSRYAKERGHQVIVITHEPLLASVFDQTVVMGGAA